MSIEVHVRVRPGIADGVWATAETVIHNTMPQSNKRFVFSKVHATTSSNTTLYRGVEPLVHAAFEGRHVTIMAYGQTGSGKSYSMTGHAGDLGVVQRCAKTLLGLIASHSSQNVTVALCMTEIYNECVRDLLDAQCRELRIVESRDGQDTIATTDATEVPIHTVEEFLHVSQRALDKRKTSATGMNEHSSRSHMIMTIVIRRGDRCSSMSLVDLAGSESASRADTRGVQLAEGAHINQSLLSLGNVVQAIVDGRKHVPYRESKLTRLLQHSLGGNGLTCIVCCVNPARENQDQTTTSLEFAQRAMKIKKDPVVVVSMPPLFMHQYAQACEGLEADIPTLCDTAYRRGLCDAYHQCVDTSGRIIQSHSEQTAVVLTAVTNVQRLLLAQDMVWGAEQLATLEQEHVRIKDALTSLTSSRTATTKRAREHEAVLEARREKAARIEQTYHERSAAVQADVAHWERERSQVGHDEVTEVDVLSEEEQALRSALMNERQQQYIRLRAAFDEPLSRMCEEAFRQAAFARCDDGEVPITLDDMHATAGITAQCSREDVRRLLQEAAVREDCEVADLESAYNMVKDELMMDAPELTHIAQLSDDDIRERIRALQAEESRLHRELATSSRESSRQRVHEAVNGGGRKLLHVPPAVEAHNNNQRTTTPPPPPRDFRSPPQTLCTPPNHSRPSTAARASTYVSPYSQRAMRSPAATPKSRIRQSPSADRNMTAAAASRAHMDPENIQAGVRSAINLLRETRERLLAQSPGTTTTKAPSPLLPRSQRQVNAAQPFSLKPPLAAPSTSADVDVVQGIAARRRLESQPSTPQPAAQQQQQEGKAGLYYLSLSPQLLDVQPNGGGSRPGGARGPAR